MPKQPPTLPGLARKALTQLGADIRAARGRRNLPLEAVAARALTTRQTVSRLEKGDPSVAIGTCATVLFVLGMVDRLADLAAPAHDELGLALDTEKLPERVRLIGHE